MRTRMPFADPLLAQYAWNIPHSLRHVVGIPNGLLRHTVADLLPAEATWRPSPGFPSAHRLRPWQAAQRADLHDIITDPASPVNALVDARRTRQLIEQPATQPSVEWHATIAYLVELNAWLTTHRIAFA
jgi:asparagine synthase (glutamine-hydrolysing)